MSRLKDTVKVVNISRGTSPAVDWARLTVLVEDSVSKGKSNLVAKHGLSFLVETSVAGVKSRILMDVGPPPDLALRNSEAMNVDIRNVDAVVISHGHYEERESPIPPIDSGPGFTIPAMRKLAKEITSWKDEEHFEHLVTHATTPPVLPKSYERSDGTRFAQARVLRIPGQTCDVNKYIEASDLFRKSGKLVRSV